MGFLLTFFFITLSLPLSKSPWSTFIKPMSFSPRCLDCLLGRLFPFFFHCVCVLCFLPILFISLSLPLFKSPWSASLQTTPSSPWDLLCFLGSFLPSVPLFRSLGRPHHIYHTHYKKMVLLTATLTFFWIVFSPLCPKFIQPSVRRFVQKKENYSPHCGIDFFLLISGKCSPLCIPADNPSLDLDSTRIFDKPLS